MSFAANFAAKWARICQKSRSCDAKFKRCTVLFGSAFSQPGRTRVIFKLPIGLYRRSRPGHRVSSNDGWCSTWATCLCRCWARLRCSEYHCTGRHLAVVAALNVVRRRPLHIVPARCPVQPSRTQSPSNVFDVSAAHRHRADLTATRQTAEPSPRGPTSSTSATCSPRLQPGERRRRRSVDSATVMTSRWRHSSHDDLSHSRTSSVTASEVCRRRRRCVALVSTTVRQVSAAWAPSVSTTRLPSPPLRGCHLRAVHQQPECELACHCAVALAACGRQQTRCLTVSRPTVSAASSHSSRRRLAPVLRSGRHSRRHTQVRACCLSCSTTAQQ